MIIIRPVSAHSGVWDPAMSMRIGDRLRAARRRWFVGREAERDLFRGALTAPDLPFSVLSVYGPGGVGKSSLLGEFAGIAAELCAAAYLIDARCIAATD